MLEMNEIEPYLSLFKVPSVASVTVYCKDCEAIVWPVTLRQKNAGEHTFLLDQ